MADVNANIGVNIETSEALAQLKSLQRQISQFHTSISKSSEAAALAQRSLQKNFLNSVNSIGAFSAELRNVKTSSESFTDSLEKNKFSMREYFRYATASTKTFGGVFKSEFDTIGKVAEERVKKLQTQYIKVGRDASGAMKAIAIIPNELNMSDYGTKVQIAAQKQAIFNQLMKQGSTNLLNFGKNTQWAGRQLMVGFTLPLVSLGTAASRTFMEMEAAALKFRKVYGDLFTPAEETQRALDSVKSLGQEFTKYGIAVSATVGLASEAAAAGFQGVDLQRQTTQATRLSVLGQIDNQKALETTISLQNAFGVSSSELANNIDFLNAVENQTVVSLDDITTAIPKVAPVIKQLGGDVKDLTFFIAAMKEGGINASEGANALKSGLAAIINPTKRASDMLAGMGININEIVTKNQGDLKTTVVEFANALNQLDPLNRAKAIEQLFGKFQFARLSTLFQNVAKDGTQASRVLDLAGTSVADLAALSEKELGMTADSAMNKFKKTVEDLKFALVPVGQTFLEAVTPILDFVGNILDKFNNLSDGVKKAITVMTVVIGGLGPVLLMTFGLLANGVANIIKLFLTLRNGYQRLTGQSQVLGEQTQYLTSEQLDAAAAASSLNQRHATLIQTFNVEREAVDKLKIAYQQALGAAQRFAMANPGMMAPKPKKFATGGIIAGAGTGTSDSIPIMASNGEAIIPAKSVNKYPQMVAGLIAGNIPGYAQGTINVGGRAVPMNFRSPANVGQIQDIVTKLMDAGDTVNNAEGILAETLFRVSKDTSVSLSGFVKELDTVAASLGNIQIPENIVGERDYSASGAGVKGNVKSQIEATRGDLGVEEAHRARVAAEATFKEYEKLGISGRKLEQALQVDRAHIVKVTHAEKRYAEAWDTRLFVAQARAENEMSMLLVQDKNQKPYIEALKRVDASENVKNSILEKITNDLGLTEEELQVQAQVLKEMQSDAALMKQTTSAFPTIAAGTIAAANARAQMGPASPGVGTRSIQEMEMARQQLIRAKFRGETQFVKQLKTDGVNAVDELLVAMERKAETASPSKRTRRLGRNIIEGLRLGLKDGEGSLIAESKKVSDIASMSKNNLYGTQGPIDPVQKSIRRQLDKRQRMSDVVGGMAANKVLEQASKRKAAQEITMAEKMSKLNSGLMAGTFALTTLAGVGSTTSGALGELSNQIFKYSGLMFALMSVTQMLTQESFLYLIAKRRETAASLLGPMAGFKRLGSGAGIMAGIKNFGKYLLTAGGYILRFGRIFLGLSSPIGLVVTGLTLTATTIFATNKHRQNEMKAIESLGKAAYIAAGELEAIKGATGTDLSKTPFETPSMFGTSTATQTQVDQFQTAIKDSKELMARVEALKGATSGQAASVLQSFGIELIARGMDPAATQDFIRALAEMGGQGKVIATAKIALDTVDLQKELSGTVTIFDKAFNPAINAANKGGKDLEKNLTLVAGVAASSFSVLSTSFSQGKINAEQFNNGIKAVRRNIDVLGKPKALYVLRKALVDLNPQAKVISGSIKSTADAFKLMQLGAMGVNLSGFIAQIQQAGSVTAELRAQMDSVFNKASRLAALKSQLAAMKAQQAEGTNGVGGSTGTGGTGTEDARLAYLRKAQAKLTIATILDVEKPAEKNFAARVDQVISSINKELKAVSVDLSIDPASINNMGDIDKALKRIDMDIEGAITPAYRAAQFQVEDLKTSTEDYAHENEMINHQVDQLETKYKKQQDALQEIGRLEAYNNSQKKRQITLADALTQGDIAAAAQAAQEMRSAQAEFANENQQKALDNNPDLLALREQIAANDEKVWQINQKIYDIQKKSIDPVDKTVKTLDREKTLLGDIKNDYDTTIGYAKSKLLIDKMSADELDREVTLRQAQLDLIGDGSGMKLSTVTITPKLDTKAIESEIAVLEKELGKTIPTGEPITNWFKIQWAKVKEIWGNFSKWWSENVWQPLMDSKAFTWLSGKFDELKQKWNDFVSNITGVAETIAAAFVAIAQLIDELVIQPLKAKWTEFTTWIGTNVIEPIKTKWTAFSTWFGTNLVTPIKTKWTEFTTWFGTNIITPIQNKWIEFKTWIDVNIIQPVKTMFGKITEPFKTAIENIGIWWDEWKTKTFDQKVLAFKNGFKSIFDPETWKGWFSGAISGLDRVFKSFINNTLIAGLNGIKLTIPTSIFGVKVPGIGGKSWGFNIEPLKLAKGGFVPGIGNKDSVPAMLTPGEFVMKKAVSEKYGSTLSSLNSGNFKSLSSPSYSASPSVNSINMPVVSSPTTSNVDNSNMVYNYNIGVSVSGSNQNANSIARAVIDEIKNIDSQRIRGQR